MTTEAGFGDLLRQLREAAGLTQEELAHAARLGVTTVSELERGRHLTCHAPTAQQLAGALGLSDGVRGLFIAAARGRAPAARALAAAQAIVPPAAARTADGHDAAAGPVPAGTARMAEPGHGQQAPFDAALSAPEVRYSLPPEVPAFTGRDDELEQIVDAVTHAAGNGGVVAIHAIDGMPGVGKTALALHVAHHLKDRFPDRQLFADLHAHTPGQEPVPPAAALAGLLTATGLDARYLPEGADARAALWRDRMAGQRALLVLDNAEGSSQVAPLLPGGKDCLVLVTSRRHLGDLSGPVTGIPVEVLPPAQAQEMFLRLAPRASPGPEVAALVRMAGHLPLAISLLARVYARHPSWTLADLAAETRASLLNMAAENDSVAAAFDLSYRYLTPRRQKFLRRLGLHVGTTIDAHAAAALAGTGVARAAKCLDTLHREGLLTEVSYRRYGMHDLVRRYARERAAADSASGRDRACGRLLEYYACTAEAAGAQLARRPRTSPLPVSVVPPAVPDLPDSASALAWTRAERTNLLACLDYVAGAGQRARVVALTAALAAWLHHDGPWAEAISRHATAVRAARDLGDLPGQARALNDLGVAQRINGDYPESAAALEQALALYRDLGDRLGQAGALNDLGVVRRVCGNYPEAAAALEEALALYRDLGERGGQAAALHDLGALKRMTGDMAGAAAALETALGIYRGLGDRLGQADALNYLGVVWRISGDYQRATAALYEALASYRDLGDRLGQASALNDLAEVRRITGCYPEAAAALEEALAIYRDLGSRLGQGNALTYLGVVRRITGCYPEAAAALEEALAIYRDLGDAGGETEVLNEAGMLYLVRGQPGQAARYHQQALDLATAMNCSWDQAHALAGLGRCALAAGDAGDARVLLGQAQQIFDLIGSAEAKEVAAELDALGG